MDIPSAVILGVLQGLTEFLPVSSSGHLVIAQKLLGWSEPEVFFDVCLHIGTLLAVLVVFRRDIADLVTGALRLPFRKKVFSGRELDVPEKTFVLVVIGTMPTIVMGLFARQMLESLFASVTAVSISLMVTGTILWLTRYRKPIRPRKIQRTTWRHVLVVGIAQSIALIPGISRSGATISTGLFVGLDREWAGRLSFLLFLPAVFGALILESTHIDLNRIQILPTLLGALSAAVVGYLALRILLMVLRSGNFYVFAPYCWALGLVSFLWSIFYGS
jgi:undecaprenyl-diphosphatase